MGRSGIRFDIAVHVGSLLAIILYCRYEVWQILRGMIHLIIFRRSEEARLGAFVILASIPLMIAGYHMHAHYPVILRDPASIAAVNAVFAILLWVVDRYSMTLRDLHHLRGWTFLAVGVAQIFALLPGASRAGTVITMARLIGFGRQASARMAFLLAIPALAGAGGLEGYSLWRDGDIAISGDMMIVAVLSFVFSMIGIRVLMLWVERNSYTPFVLYRLLFSAVIVGWLYAGDFLPVF